MRIAAFGLFAGVVTASGHLGAQPNSPVENEPAKPPVVCSASVDVHVVDLKSHQPIAGAIVIVRAAGNENVALSDADGHSVVRDLCSGDVVIEASRVDYEPKTKTLTLQRDRRTLELELSAFVGEEIVIEGAVRRVDLQSSTDVTGEALVRKRGRSFSEVLAEVPGVSQLGSASGVSKPIVRGQFGRRLLLLVDGVRHRAQEWGLDHAPEIDPFTAGSIRVVRGAAGVQYGSDAIGGAIIVEPPSLRQQPGVSGEAHLVSETNGRGGSVAGRVQAVPRSVPRLSWQAEGSFKRLAGARAPSYALDNTGVQEWNVAGAAGYRLRDADFKLSYRHYQARLGVCACLNIESSEDFFEQLERDEPLGVERFDDDFEIERPLQSSSHDQLLARARFRPGGIGTVTATYALQWDHRREFDVVRNATGPQFNFELWSHDVGVELRHKPIHLNSRLHLRGKAGVFGVGQFHDYAGLPLVPDHRAFGGGGFASERLLGHDFEIEAGLRYELLSRRASIEDQDFARLVRSGQITDDACAGANSGNAVDCDSTFHTFSASLGALYQLASLLTVKVEASTASRAPNPDEQYLNGTSPTLPVLGLGKPDLSPETTYSTSATLTYASDRVRGEVSGYANLITDYIYFAPAIGPDGMPIFDVLVRGSFPRFVTRPVDALFYGADGAVAVKPTHWLEVGIQAAMVRAKNRSDGSRLVFVPPDQARATLTATRASVAGFRNLFAQVATTVVARQSRFDLAADLAPPPSGYATLDAEIGAETTIENQVVKVALAGRNLTNARYREYTSLTRYFADRPGWQASLRLSIFFGETE